MEGLGLRTRADKGTHWWLNFTVLEAIRKLHGGLGEMCNAANVVIPRRRFHESKSAVLIELAERCPRNGNYAKRTPLLAVDDALKSFRGGNAHEPQFIELACSLRWIERVKR